MTYGDICRHFGLKTQKRAGDRGVNLPVSGSPRRPIKGRPTMGYFFVAVIAEGDVSLMVLPSTVPEYFVVPAVKVISAPRRRP